jgi:hypothetical protein
MTTVARSSTASSVAEVPYVQWGPIFAGAIVAAGLAFVLHSFAAAIGLAAASTAPTWRDASSVLWLTSGLYLILVALASYGFGGYIAGRMRSRWASAAADETEFRDGMHGLLVWAVATLITALLAFAAVQSVTRIAAPSGGPAGPTASVGGENIIAYDLDKLFRTDRRPANIDMAYARSEASRILLMASSHDGIPADDRSHLVRLTSGLTGVAEPEAEKRVEASIISARENIGRARRSGVILAFMTGAAALLGAAAAWYGACAGGAHRDSEVAPSVIFRAWRIS